MIDIKPEDLNICSWSSTPVSPWTSAKTNGIRILHKPSGIEVMFDCERSQHKNRALCMQHLKERLEVWDDAAQRHDVGIDILIANLMMASRKAGHYRGKGRGDEKVNLEEDEALKKLQEELVGIAK